MICQATYDSLDAIPDNLRDEFHQVNGRWQMKDTAVPGVGQLFNQALAANEQKAVGQVKTRNERIKILEEENNQLKDRISVLDQPGHQILSKEDSSLWESYINLGTPKEIETALSDNVEFSKKLQKFETRETLEKISNARSDAKINPDVLTDWATSTEGQDLKFFVKTVEQVDAKGVKSNVETPFVRIEKKNGDKLEVSERELLPFAKEVLPEWKYAALTTVVGDNKDDKSANGHSSKPVGVKLPDLSSAHKQVDTSGDKKRPVDEFNEKRAARPNPFTKPVAAIAGSIQVKS